ncbi:hypothetical protein MTAT_20280 [Moorella thermoacetica]|uniref:Uncharacterized protein n=1 Tax=Neomoorella thermoacetica TaxID=1525 RepID=A0AAC9HIU0_NEOTH|nr:hypothetical protein [Moorella thermoacetica]AOQ24683.1 hypothetical protein Maut_02255 [Moorella thermoacetica]TYL12786.1 hypothetical protein MTAT_20280 [Moorella thermoacetica]
MRIIVEGDIELAMLEELGELIHKYYVGEGAPADLQALYWWCPGLRLYIEKPA